MLSLVLSNNWCLKQIHVNDNFLHDQLMEKVFMKQPIGFIDQAHPHHVNALQKSIYNLKQNPTAWYSTLRSFLLEMGFVNSKFNSSLFIFNRDRVQFYILVYVDDLILTGNNNNFLQHVVITPGDQFSLKELCDLHYFIGVEVIPIKECFFFFYLKTTMCITCSLV